ncbi:uncharacterized protein [Triticum aestivum]|uniref:uncharacterized protein n=1 Tax=Triticum aestivum TaxID=4565 RepID=UPI001D017F66|nr:uncharacterized protein LOC123057355 [Triticum aestivum]
MTPKDGSSFPVSGYYGPDLPSDALRDISGRLPDAADFFRFHAVCKPWRDTSTPIQSSPPWLLAAPEKDSVPLRFRCVFAKSSYRAQPSISGAGRKIWLSTADVAAIRYLTVEHLRPSLHDPLTGAVNHLPLLPHACCVDGQEENLRGAVFGDGTTLLYGISTEFVSTQCSVRAEFKAALLRPGDTKWTIVERTLWKAGTPGEHCVVYRNGRILVTVNGSLWHVITLDAGDLLLQKPGERERYSSEQYSYILESRGELLWVTVQFKIYYDYGGVFMEVYKLDGEASATPEKTRWMKKDGRSLADRVLFLGSPNTFAIDTSLLGGHGGRLLCLPQW